MAKVQERTARKDYPANGIKKGDRYFYVAIKTGPRSSRTIRSLTRPKRWELTGSDFYSQLWPIEDEGFDKVSEASDLNDIAEELRNLGSEQQDKFDNMPEGLQHGDTGQMLEERANACEEWADGIETAANELEEALSTFDGAVEACKAHIATTEHDIVAENWSVAEKCAAIGISEQLNAGELRSLVLARTALEASHHAELVEALRWFVDHGKDIAMDVKAGHVSRADAASEWMREDDYNFRLNLSDAFAQGQSVLAKIGGDV